MGKIDKIIIILLMFIVGCVFLVYANIFATEIRYLKSELSHYYTGWNPQCPINLDPYACARLQRLCELQLKAMTLLNTLFTTIGWVLLISGIICVISMGKSIEERYFETESQKG